MDFVNLETISTKIDYGLTESATDQDTGNKFLRITDIRQGKINWAEVPFCECNESDAKKYELQEGDIVFARTGSVGNTGLIRNDAPKGSVFASYLIRIRPNKELIDPEYLAYYFQTPEYWRQIDVGSVGAIQGGLNATKLSELRIPFPPLTEQKRIASLLARADRLRQLRRTARALADSLLQSVFLEMFGKAKGKMKEAKLGEISDIASGVTKGQNYKGRKTVEVPYLRVANVQDGYLDLSEIKTIQALPSEVEELRLQIGDVVMTEGGDFDKLGRGAIWRGQIENCIHQNHIFRVRLDKSKVTPEFFENYLLGSDAKKYFLTASKQTTNLASINMTQLKQLPVPLYPLPLQEEFASIVARVEQMRRRMSEAERQAESLFQSLLAESFGG